MSFVEITIGAAIILIVVVPFWVARLFRGNPPTPTNPEHRVW